MNVINLLQILIICGVPYLANRLVKRFEVESWLSPVVISYGIGILMANFQLFEINRWISTQFSHLTVLLAIPLLLYATDVLAWFRNSKSTILSFGFSILATIIAVVLFNYFYTIDFTEPSIAAGMVVGVYSGGTPNMQAVGIALGAGEEAYVLLYAADIFCGGIYLLLLTSVAHRLLSFLLPNYIPLQHASKTSTEAKPRILSYDLLQAFLLTVIIVAISIGITIMTPGGLENSSVLILLLTTFSILASFRAEVRKWTGTYEAGEYLLLMFCVAVGMLSDFRTLLEDGGEVVRYMGIILLLTILIHLLLCKLFKIDRDTAMITSTAAIYGPVFVGQVASAIDNRELVVAGIACGLVGMAIGNYLGIGMGWILQ